MLVLAVIVPAGVVQLLRRERHKDSHLRRGEHAADFHVVVPERENRVQSPALPVLVGVHLDGVLPCHGDDAHGLRVQLLLALRIGVNKTREDVKALILVL